MSVTVCPGLIRFGFALNCGFRFRSSESEILFCAAIAERVSPLATVYDPPPAGAGAGVGAGVYGV